MGPREIREQNSWDQGANMNERANGEQVTKSRTINFS